MPNGDVIGPFTGHTIPSTLTVTCGTTTSGRGAAVVSTGTGIRGANDAAPRATRPMGRTSTEGFGGTTTGTGSASVTTAAG